MNIFYEKFKKACTHKKNLRFKMRPQKKLRTTPIMKTFDIKKPIF